MQSSTFELMVIDRYGDQAKNTFQYIYLCGVSTEYLMNSLEVLGSPDTEMTNCRTLGSRKVEFWMTLNVRVL